jgi:hypothetical protein
MTALNSPIKIQYKPLPKQSLAHKSTKERVAYIGGYGAGKTYWLIHHLFKIMNLNKGVPGGLLCPSLKMAKRDVIPTLREVCAKNRIIFDYNKSDFALYFPQTKSQIWIFHGEDDGESIRGPNLGFMGINEFTLISENTYLAAMARVRHPNARRLQTFMSGTFEEYGGVYDVVTNDEDCEVIYGSSRENTYLPTSYIRSLEKSFDEEMQKQYIDGLPVRRLGKAAVRRFRRDLHLNPNANRIPDLPVWVSLDFNVDPLGAVLWNRMPLDSKVKLRAFGEIKLSPGDTPMVAKQLKEMFGNDITIFPDPAGNSRSTKGLDKSDIQILKDFGFQNIRFKRSIRSVKDCLNAVEAMFDNNEIEIHPNCKEFIKDLEQCKFKDNDFQIDKKDSKRSHWLDGFKDMVDLEFPVSKPVLSTQRQW